MEETRNHLLGIINDIKRVEDKLWGIKNMLDDLVEKTFDLEIDLKDKGVS